jgi:hypothetical protein
MERLEILDASLVDQRVYQTKGGGWCSPPNVGWSPR